MDKIVRGEMAFLPSDLTLLQFSSDMLQQTPQRWVRVSKPTHVLVVENEKNTPYCMVLYNGERWSVPRSEIYPIKEVC